MNRGVATSAPTAPHAQMRGVILLADVDLSGSNPRGDALVLSMAFQAKIIVTLHEQLGVDRPVRGMTYRATFPHRFVFVNEGAALLAMALAAGLVFAGHGQAPGWLHDFHAMRVMALDTVHFSLRQWMMVRQVELGVRFKMTAKTRG